MVIEKNINKIEEKLQEIAEATGVCGITIQIHSHKRGVYGFIHQEGDCSYCANKKEIINTLRNKELLFRKLKGGNHGSA